MVAPKEVDEDKLDDFAKMQRKFYGLDKTVDKKQTDLKN